MWTQIYLMFALICPVVHLRYLAPALEIKTTQRLW